MFTYFKSAQQSTRKRRRIFTAFGGSLLILTLAACGDSEPEAENPSNSGETEQNNVIPEEIDDPVEAATAAYERYWRVVAETTAEPSDDIPAQMTAFEDIASGQAIEHAKLIFEDAAARNIKSDGVPTHEISIKDTYPDDDPDQVVIVDCRDSNGWIVLDAETGDPVENEEYGKRHIEALVRHIDENWVVTQIAARGLGSC